MEVEGQTETHGDPKQRWTNPVRMVLTGPSSLAELTAGESLSEPLERSNWLVMEL